MASVQRTFFVRWFRQHGRDFPWRRTGTSPYAFLVTEMLLRQTRATSVATLWEGFLARFPDAAALAGASPHDLEARLACLGFGHQRAAALVAAANWLMDHHNGYVPNTEEELLAVPHVGLYGARAVLCFAYGKRLAVVDANILRFFSRHEGLPTRTDIRRNPEVWELAEKVLPYGATQAREHNFGLLDFTADVCKPRGARCGECPLARSCAAPASSDH